jgi:hypothetical protein
MKEVLIKAVMVVVAAFAAGIVAAEGAGDGRQGAVPEELRGLPPADRQRHPGAFPALAGSKFVQGKAPTWPACC